MDESSESADEQAASEDSEEPAFIERGASETERRYIESGMSDGERAVLRSQLFSTTLNLAGYDDPMVVSWDDARSVATEKRLEILDVLGSDVEIESQRALARDLDRNYSDVSDDLDILYGVGVVEREHPDRNTVRPVLATETVVVNPILVNGEHLPAKTNVTTFSEDPDEPEERERDAEARP